eukprot:CAMPEP_0175362104 /NCGR_PEP_ID=MMETSP0095-20121207/16906_1 /TAXON_ID=311494 /ORGANISM="Alexandrium monilatum, Strain CCMP3105" /LENGTH=40 /DNA_ID= /DNA_START= /DNA_END= /DNA_ORIENTATION=
MPSPQPRAAKSSGTAPAPSAGRSPFSSESTTTVGAATGRS